MNTLQLFQTGYKPRNASKTQISSTVNTYKNILNLLPDNKQLNILDYGSGFGYGALHINHETMHNCFAYEPYYNVENGVFHPDYENHWSIHGQFDVIILNNVLNVVPDDVRAKIIKRVYRMLKDGGSAYINVNSKSAILKNKGIWLSDNEVLTTRGTYQKGFTRSTLKREIIRSLYKYASYELTNSNHANNGVKLTKLKAI